MTDAGDTPAIRTGPARILARMVRAWRRSLQFRVVATTLVLGLSLIHI